MPLALFCRIIFDMKAVLLGTGWRAQFFMRISQSLPDVLEITSVYTHTEERADEIREEGFKATTDLDEALSASHSAVIISSGKSGYYDMLLELHARGERIISETAFFPFSDDELDMIEGFDGMVMEQYQFTPLFASVLNSLPLLRDIDQLYLSGLHNHHSAAIARKVLSLGFDMPDESYSMDFPSRIVKTGSRKGLELSGEIEEYVRRVRVMRFGPSFFIHDFSSNQYHSYLYGKSFEIRGASGVITEKGLCTVDGSGYPLSVPFVFHRDVSMGNGSLTLTHVTLGERTVFVNPYYPICLNDDEIGMARMLELFGKGEDVYSFREGVADARLGKLL